LQLLITPLGKQHNRHSFDCGEDSLNQYLKRFARQDIQRQLNRVFVVSPSDDPELIYGYYSLSASTLVAASLPERLQQRLPRYPVPTVLLGRLAVATDQQGQGIGGIMLVNAMQRAMQASQVMAIYAIIVDALNDPAVGFYRQFGFISLPGQSRKLFLPIDTVSRLLENPDQSSA